jgi:hypothetical protein
MIYIITYKSDFMNKTRRLNPSNVTNVLSKIFKCKTNVKSFRGGGTTIPCPYNL